VQQNLQIHYALFVSLTLPLPARIRRLRWQLIRRPVKQEDRDSGKLIVGNYAQVKARWLPAVMINESFAIEASLQEGAGGKSKIGRDDAGFGVYTSIMT
jgi:hypothetical protein